MIILLEKFLFVSYSVSVDVTAFRRGILLTPQEYSPMNGDLNIQLQHFSQKSQPTVHTPTSNVDDSDVESTFDVTDDVRSTFNDVQLRVNRVDGNNQTTVTTLAVYPDTRLNTTQITIGCLHFLYGGTYELEIVENNVKVDDIGNHDERLRQRLDVKWPQPNLTVTPTSIGTYPQQTIDAIIEFPGLECLVPHSQMNNMPEFWLELYYCGHDMYCDSTNITAPQILYAEQVRGYPKARLIKMRCEFFGLAGHYIVKLRPVAPVPASVTATAYIKVI